MEVHKWAEHGYADIMPENDLCIDRRIQRRSTEGGIRMRIEAYTQVQQIYDTKKAAKSRLKGNAGASDQLQISSFGKDIQAAKQAVAASSDIREDVTASIKARLQSGNYEVSTDSFADKLMQKYEEMR